MKDSAGRITRYLFGEMEIDTRKYTEDVIINGDEVIGNWRRRKGHHLEIDDIPREFRENITHIIIGTGYYGMMSVSSSFGDYCKLSRILLESMRTSEAVEWFNECSEGNNLLGAFHLTC